MNRKREAEGRSDAVLKFNKVLEMYRSKVNSDACAHLEDADAATVRETCQSASTWINEQIQTQTNLASSVDPCFTLSDISAREKVVHTKCRPIVNKPKPKPKPVVKEEVKEPTKEEEKKTDEKTESADAKGATTENAKENEDNQQASTEADPMETD